MTRIADFTTGTYTGITPTCTRSTIGFATTTAGVLTNFAINTLRRTDAGLLVEPAATNLLSYSQQFDQSSFWDSVSATITANAVAGPDGTTTADQFTAVSSFAQVGFNSTPLTVTAATAYMFSFFIKRNTAGKQAYVQFNDSDSGGGSFMAWAQYFNLTTLSDGGTEVLVGGTESPSNVTVTALGSGWFRCSVTITTAGTTVRMRAFVGFADTVGNRTATTGTSAYFWGAENTLGSVLYSYFETTTASAARAADTVNFTTPSGATLLTYTFDDSSTQNAIVTPSTSYNIPTNLNRQVIKYIDDNNTPGVTGTGAATLGGLTGAASGAVGARGVGSATLGGLTGAGVGASGVRGVGSATLGSLVGAGSGTVGTVSITGTGSATLGGLLGAGSGIVPIIGVGAATFGSLIGSGAGVVPPPAQPYAYPIIAARLYSAHGRSRFYSRG